MVEDDRTPNAAPAAESGNRTPARLGAWIVGVVGALCVFGGLALGFEIGLSKALVYKVGKPMTATIDHCASQGAGGEICYGRWGTGSSGTGPILGDYDHRVGSQLDVHLVYNRNNGTWTAYTASVASPRYVWLSGGLLTIATGSVLIWSARRRIKTGNWPWSGRRPSLHS